MVFLVKLKKNVILILIKNIVLENLIFLSWKKGLFHPNSLMKGIASLIKISLRTSNLLKMDLDNKMNMSPLLKIATSNVNNKEEIFLEMERPTQEFQEKDILIKLTLKFGLLHQR